MDKIDYNFETTKTPKELAYFLGFLWADGTINRNSCLIIEILKNDGEELFNIFNKLHSFSLSYRKREGRQEQMTYYYGDRKFATFLKEHGKYPKTTDSHKKILDYIPEKYITYFLRGLVDGDGCFSAEKPNKYYNNTIVMFDISGRYDQDWSSLIDYFYKKLNIKLNVYKWKKEKTSGSRIKTQKFSDIEKIVNFLYNEKDNIWLKRKYEKANHIIEEHKLNKNILIENKPKYKITVGNETPIITNNLSQYCKINNYCYRLMIDLANNKINKYKNIKIEKLIEERNAVKG